MSRKEWKNETFRFVAGVDNLAGPFVHVFLMSSEYTSLSIDRTDFKIRYNELPMALGLYLRMLRRESIHDSIIVTKIAKLLGFNIEKEINELWESYEAF